MSIYKLATIKFTRLVCVLIGVYNGANKYEQEGLLASIIVQQFNRRLGRTGSSLLNLKQYVIKDGRSIETLI